MKKEQQVLVIIVVGIIAFLFIYFKFLLLPLNSEIKAVRSDIKKKSDQLEEARKLESELPQLREETQALEQEIAKLEKKLPTKPDIPQLIKIISKNSQYYNVKISNIVIKDMITSSQEFNEIPFSINFVSNYHNLAQFLVSIAQGERIFAARDLVINYTGSTEKSNYLAGNCTIFSYTLK